MNHVLICTDDGALQKRLTAAARHTGLGVYCATRAPMALKIMTEHQPALVLLDQSFENPTALEVAANLASLNAQTRIVLLVRQGHFELSRSALRTGIADLVLIPGELERLAELLGRLSHSVQTQTSHTEGRAAAFFAVKGGAGCTTLALNTAVACTALVPGPVLLVDGHMQTADVSAVLDVKCPRSVADLLPVMDELTPGHIRDTAATHESGLHVLLAPPEAALGHQVLPEHLARIVRVARRAFAAIIIDCPPPLDEGCAALLAEAGTPVLVSTPEAPSVIAWRRLKHLAGSSPGRIRLAVNQVSARAEISPRDLAGLLDLPGMGEVRLDSATLTALINTGKTLFDIPPGSKRPSARLPAVAQDVLRLARRLLA